MGVLFTDFRKAFYSVNHTILQEELTVVGISGTLLSGLADYMSALKHFVQSLEINLGSKLSNVVYFKAQL